MKREGELPAVAVHQLDQSPPPASWRDDLVEVGVVAVVIGAGGVLAGVVLVASGLIATLLSFGVYLAVLLAAVWLPFAILAGMKVRTVTERHRLAWTRSQTERWTLLTMLDADLDGDTDDEEIMAFLRYVRHCYFGGETTAVRAQRMGVAGPVWQRYRNAMIAMAIAQPVDKKGGLGFELRPGVQQMPWPRIERRIRDALLTRARLDIIPSPVYYSRNNPENSTNSGNIESGEGVRKPVTAGKQKAIRDREPVSTLPPDVAIGAIEEWD